MSQAQAEDWRLRCRWHLAHCVRELRTFGRWFKGRKDAADGAYYGRWDGTAQAPEAEEAARRAVDGLGACCVRLGEFHGHASNARDLLVIHDAPDRAAEFMRRVDEVAHLACELDNRARTRPLPLVQPCLVAAIADLDRFGMELLHAVTVRREQSNTAPPEAVDDVPALTRTERIILEAMASLPGAELASVEAIVDSMPVAETVSERTVGRAVQRFIELGLAERPEGDRLGARLTRDGRRLVAELGR